MEIARATTPEPKNATERYSCDMDEKAVYGLLRKVLQEDRLRDTTKEQRLSALSETDGIEWASRKDFNVDVGKQQIEAYIKTWDIRPSWVCYVDFLRSVQEGDYTVYLYEARFSAPTARRPITETVSVYFAVEVSAAEAETLPVQVRFVLESRRLVHTPGRHRLCENPCLWALDFFPFGLSRKDVSSIKN
uniref:Uncharacterized protein n=1 Tax=Fundulus heteroclitus TaxID=8078 RepID=A0A3Q2NMJ5_FUNHE